MLTSVLADLHQTIHPVLIVSGNELILVDAAYPNQLADIESEIRRVGFELKDVAKDSIRITITITWIVI